MYKIAAKKKIKKSESLVVGDHILVPKHTKLSEKERKELLESYKIRARDLPRISMKDPAIAGMELTTADIIKVERDSPTSKHTVFYRRVVK